MGSGRMKRLLSAAAIAALLASPAMATSPTMQFPTTGWSGYAPNRIQCGELLGANMNTTADQPIQITVPSALYDIDAIEVSSASTSLTTAVGGVYPAASKGGTAIVANSQAYSTLTAAAPNAAGSTMLLTLAGGVATTAYNLGTIYFSLTTPQGAAATANIRVRCTPHYR